MLMSIFNKKSSIKTEYVIAGAKVRKIEKKLNNLSPCASERKEERLNEKLARAIDEQDAIKWQIKHPATQKTSNKTTISPKVTININKRKK